VSTRSRVPPNVKAVAEVRVSLITGRTHQIRGQLSQLGFPIVGDEHYGGTLSMTNNESCKGPEGHTTSTSQITKRQLLALQCCDICFPYADYETVWSKKRRRHIVQGYPNKNNRKIHATLDFAWWTPLLDACNTSTSFFGSMDPSREAFDEGNATTVNTSAPVSSKNGFCRPDLLPAAVQLSSGKNKYIIAKFRDPVTHKTRWFVRSSSPTECGGPYHANIAENLTEWIRNVPGYESVNVEITGGGRIDYAPRAATTEFDGTASTEKSGIVRVYGFSYRYGKGDHRRAAELIQEFLLNDSLNVTYDLSDDLY
jgi:hypothetical protein